MSCISKRVIGYDFCMSETSEPTPVEESPVPAPVPPEHTPFDPQVEASSAAATTTGFVEPGPNEGLPNSPSEDVSPAPAAVFEGAPSPADAEPPVADASEALKAAEEAQRIRQEAEDAHLAAEDARMEAESLLRTRQAEAVAADQRATVAAEKAAAEKRVQDRENGIVEPPAEIEITSRVPLSTRPHPTNPGLRIETFRNPDLDR